MRRVPEALRLFKTLNEKAVSEDSSASRVALNVSLLIKQSLRAQMSTMYRCTLWPQQHIHETKGRASFDGRTLYPYVASLRRELKNTHSAEFEKQSSRFEEVLLSKIARKMNFSLVMKKMYLNAKSLFSDNPVNKINL